MTEPRSERCRWCGRRLPAPQSTGRRREFCRQSCRQQDYLRRQRAREAGLAEHELVVTRGELDDLHDRLYVLEAAVEDVDRDLPPGWAEGAGDDRDVRDALRWLLDAAAPLVARRLGDPAQDGARASPS